MRRMKQLLMSALLIVLYCRLSSLAWWCPAAEGRSLWLKERWKLMTLTSVMMNTCTEKKRKEKKLPICRHCTYSLKGLEVAVSLTKKWLSVICLYLIYWVLRSYCWCVSWIPAFWVDAYIPLMRQLRAIVSSPPSVNVIDDFGVRGGSSNSILPWEFTSQQSGSNWLFYRRQFNAAPDTES